jgi:serine/threonine-protein kinase
VSLPIGARIGPYEVTARLGAGGMGEVFRATDTNLGRQVAIKVLPDAFARDADRVARFEREARTLAALNHPNIGQIHGLERGNGITALALELVEGPTLAERIARGPLGVAEALPIARQIAEALEAAHEQGIVHRDLKPANIKVRSDGTVKVLDYGLAKAIDPDDGRGDTGAAGANSPTVTSPAMTLRGVILGTAAYMSPEQARGKPVDKRADIWALGCVIYEMLTGRRAFPGAEVSDVLASVLAREPDWTRLPADVPPVFRAHLVRCLHKDRRERIGDAQSLRLAIEGAFEGPGVVQQGPARTKAAARRRAIAWAVAIVIGLAAALAAAWRLGPVESRPVARFIALVETQARRGLASPVVSPNGQYLAYTWGLGGAPTLSLHAIADLEREPVLELRGATHPFFSPDSAWLGFFSGNELKKVSVRGGAPVSLARAPSGRGASWGRDGWIVFAPSFRSGLSRVSELGGPAEPITTPDASLGEGSHRFPVVLPNARAIVCTTLGSQGPSLVAILPGTGERRVLVEGAEYARHLPTGHLAFQQGRRLMAARFDMGRPAIVGAAVPVIDDIGQGPAFGVSDQGLLVYRSGTQGPSRLVWVDRNGAETPFLDERSSDPIAASNGRESGRGVLARKVVPPLPMGESFAHPRISPDGRRIVLDAGNLWVYDLRAGSLAQLTFQGGAFPIWTLDSARVIYARPVAGTAWDIFWRRADGSGDEERLVARELDQVPTGAGISSDGQLFVFKETTPDTSADLWLRSMRDGSARVFLRGPADEFTASFSPDSRYLAYVSNELGDYDVYIRPLTGEGGQRRVSYDGGTEPLWSSGGELFYRSGSQMVVVDVKTSPDLTVGTPRRLFEGPYVRSGVQDRNYDVTPDGQRFLMVRAADVAEGTVRLNAVVNWFEELDRLVPSR